MSGNDESTGWSHFSPTKVDRYARIVEGQSNDLAERLDVTGLDWYPDAHGGLHVKCSAGRLWEILSGEPDTSTPDTRASHRAAKSSEKEYISVTNLGAAVTRTAIAPSTVQKMLRRAGLMVRVDGKEVPTEAARGLFFERPLESRPSAYGAPRPGAVQRLWAFETVALLKALPPDKPSKPRKPPPMTEGQADYLKTLCEQTGEPYPSNLTKSEASERIDELKGRERALRVHDPDRWHTSQEPMTERQAEYLQQLCEATGKAFDDSLSKGTAAKWIDELRAEADPILEAQGDRKIQQRIEQTKTDQASGPSFGTREAARFIGRRMKDIHADISANQLVGYVLHPKSLRLPCWQFEVEFGKPHGWVPSLIEAFGENGWPLLVFLTITREGAEGKSYLELLLDGREERVMAAAKIKSGDR